MSANTSATGSVASFGAVALLTQVAAAAQQHHNHPHRNDGDQKQHCDDDADQLRHRQLAIGLCVPHRRDHGGVQRASKPSHRNACCPVVHTAHSTVSCIARRAVGEGSVLHVLHGDSGVPAEEVNQQLSSHLVHARENRPQQPRCSEARQRQRRPLRGVGHTVNELLGSL
ncbi:hypothetical protein TraAM80_08658 [Trypanosoma rangeli]|uniref:Secreted protein n=1 Tax=Trypanosoma rangeli TaxID=5698 RepID=A0A422MZM1_TRYRA|nr:uncharacterized protein TraAM80_08658 [Trypanosoma rangeli]RNE98637.1 hypothetical protein TraAM80_08658 [Trypanosoma rangeli]|eukprot:RNE98637.1 hypothetical protein TraAM80_08658 [Trypanosoma rangeli]